MSWATTHVFSVGEILTAANMNLIQNNINAIAPVGSYLYVAAVSAGNGVESVWQGGWLECNNAAVSRSTYSSLFTYLNGLSPALPFGNGNNTTTFNTPDYQARFPVHHVVGGHADVGTLGGSDGITFSTRRPKHRTSSTLAASNGTLGTTHNLTLPDHSHATSFLDTAHGYQVTGSGHGADATAGSISTGSANSFPSINGSVSLTGSVLLTGSIGTNNANDTLDSSPYLVGGIWVIKF